MGDLTPRGLPAGHNNSKIRRKQLEIQGLEYAIAQRQVDILEKEEDINSMQQQVVKMQGELRALEEQFGKN